MRPLLLPAISLLASSILLSGCSTAFTPVASTGGAALTGEAYGGQAPIVGAAIYAFSSGTGAYGAASTSLIAAGGIPGYSTTAGTYGNYVTTDSTGYFEIDLSTPCTVGSVTYLYSVGGNPGAGNNTAAGLMTALGVCTDGILVDSVSSSRIHMNEVGTVAAAYALAGFATDATDISAPSATDTLAATGIHNAVNTAAQLYSFVPNNAGDAGSIANATTPNGNGAVPQAEIDSIANSLASCVNSTAAGASCTTLLGDAKSGGTTGTTPTDTATAAINMAHNPTANVTAIYNLGTSNPAFGTVLTAAPNDFSIQIIFTGNGLIEQTYIEVPATVAIDAAGNVWNVNYSTTAGTVSEFSPLGVPVNLYSVGAYASSVTIDSAGNAWTANFASDTLSEITTSGTVNTVSAGLGLNYPLDIAFDGAGNMFIANAEADTVVKASATGTYIGVTTKSVEGLDFDNSLAIEPGTPGTGNAGYVFAGNESDVDVAYLTNAPAGSSEPKATSRYDDTGGGVAVDALGNAWIGFTPTGSVIGGIGKVTPGSTTITVYTPGSGNTYIEDIGGIAMDGSSHVWMTDYDNGYIYEITDAGVSLLGTKGLAVGGSSTTGYFEPDGIAVDGSGNVWYDTSDDAALHEIVGAATPVVTPLATAVKSSTTFDAKP